MFGKTKKLIILVSICIILIIYLSIEYETINIVTEYNNITHVSSPFEDTKYNKKTNNIMNAVDKIILTQKNIPEQSTREIIYQLNIHSKGGHTENIICFGDRLLHCYDGQCIGEYRVPLITQLYLYFIYGRNK